MTKGRLEDIQKIVDEHYIIYYWPGDFATGVYHNGQRKRQPFKRKGKKPKIRPK